MPRSKKGATATATAAVTATESRTRKNLPDIVWSDGSNGSSFLDQKSSVCHMSDFHDLNRKNRGNNTNQKTRKSTARAPLKEHRSIHDQDEQSKKQTTSIAEELKKQTAKSDEKDQEASWELPTYPPLSTSSPTSSSYSESSDSLFCSSCSSFSEGDAMSSEDEKLNTHFDLRRRTRKEAEASRGIHSNRPMFLSRRMSIKLTTATDIHSSPGFSPISAMRISYSPKTIAFGKTTKLATKEKCILKKAQKPKRKKAPTKI